MPRANQACTHPRTHACTYTRTRICTSVVVRTFIEIMHFPAPHPNLNLQTKSQQSQDVPTLHKCPHCASKMPLLVLNRYKNTHTHISRAKSLSMMRLHIQPSSNMRHMKDTLTSLQLPGHSSTCAARPPSHSHRASQAALRRTTGTAG